MKNVCLKSLIVLAVLTSSSLVKAENKTVVMKPQFIFTPKSFDSNDNAQIVLAGAFTGYCMKMGNTQQRVDKELKKIYIKQLVSKTGNCDDLEMYIPYSNVINLGSLPAGNYEVLAANENASFTKMSMLPVHEASANTSGTDERLYAPVSSIDFKIAGSLSSPVVTLKGVFTNSCLQLSGVEVYSRTGDVYEVLPIVKKGNANCTAVMRPFAKTIELKNFSTRVSLIHVRSMNGQSLNRVITNLDRLNQ
jgi:hypothetical protein